MGNNSQEAIKISIFSILENALLAIVKFLAGFFGNSYALIADAIESATDTFSSIFVFFGLKYSSRPADENHPYGHGKAETLITFLVVTFLIVSAIIISVESIKNIITPHRQPEPFTLLILVAIIVFKELSFQYIMRKGKETNSSSLMADAWHHRSDAITSLMAFIGISISLVMGNGWEAADDIAALLAATIIVYNAYKILRIALGEIMDEQLYDVEMLQIKEISLSVKDVMAIEKCNIRKSGMDYYVDLHAIVDGNMSVVQGHEISHNLKDAIQEKMKQVKDVLIHIEPTFLSVKEYLKKNNIQDKRGQE